MTRSGRRARCMLMVPALLVLSSCIAGVSGAPPAVNTDPLDVRVRALQAAIDDWAAADDLPSARAAAEVAAALVTGPGVSGFGDRDGDGSVGGTVSEGLLPGEHGEAGLASDVGSSCLDADVLGGSWDDPAARWAELRDAISRWSPTDNTFPALRSHPQRIVGWASLTLATGALATAHEYAGHAQIHIDVTGQALALCPLGG